MIADYFDAHYPADPYPGARPGTSFVHSDHAGYAITPDEDTAAGWSIQGTDLDDYLADHGEAPLHTRKPVLAYGSNMNPSKISWLRDQLQLPGMAVVIKATCHNLAAVWSAGIRARDRQRPAVLAAWPGAEEHAVWLATPEQRHVLDVCEGRGERYRLAWVRATLELDGDAKLDRVLAYIARSEVIGQDVAIHLNRSPLLVDGQLVRCADLPQDDARELVGVAADSDGLDVTEVHGEP